MIERCDIERAATLLRQGGVLAYPTEAVFGLGCDPRQRHAVSRILALKGRPQEKGLILIASSEQQVLPWINNQDELELARPSWPGPVTWVFSASADTPDLLCQPDHSIAIRVTDHPVAKALCDAFGNALVSTSANPAGLPPANDAVTLDAYFDGKLDALLSGRLGQRQRPSEIRDARTGKTLRP